MRSLRQPREAGHRVLSPQVVAAELRLERGDAHLVHLDIWPVEFHAGDPIAHVGLPPQRVGAQVEELDIPVVIASADTALGVIVGIAEGDGPAVAGGLALLRLTK